MLEAALKAPRRAWKGLRRGDLDVSGTNIVAGSAVVIGALVWLAGFLALPFLGSGWSGAWNASWAVAGISFLGSFAIPTPGATTALFAGLSQEPALAVAAVVGATVGATLGAIFLLLAGHALRARLKRKATKGKVARFFLRWAQRLVHKFAYVGVLVLLSLPFVPRAVVLYAASLVDLNAGILVATIALGHLLRYTIFMAAVAGLLSL